MTLAVCSRPEPPSVEFNMPRGLESDLVDAVHSALSPEVPLGRIIVHVRPARDGDIGLIQITMMQAEDDREGMRVFAAQVVSAGSHGAGQVFITRLAVPPSLRGNGIALAMVRRLYEATTSHRAVMVMCDLDEIAVARLVKRGAYRLSADAVQVVAGALLD